MYFQALFDFLKDNILFILIFLMFSGLMLIKPFRRFAVYCAKNITALVIFIAVSFLCSLFGHTIPVNAFSAASAILLGLPGISLALFLSLVI